MSDTSTVQQRIAQLFAAKLNLDIPSADTDLFETSALDSLGVVELLLQLEREFGVRVSVDQLEIESFRSIAKIADFVLAQNGASGERGAHLEPA